MSHASTSLSAVLATAELERRPSQPIDEATEGRILVALHEAVSGPAAIALQRAAEAAAQLCQAGSAGVSVLEDQQGQTVFRWRAACGAFAPYRGAAMLRAHSPSGTVLELNGPQLMVMPERHFAVLAGFQPAIREWLEAPLAAHGRPCGTLWVAVHDDNRTFTPEDRRVLLRLARLAGMACERLPGNARLSRSSPKRILVVDDGVDAAESLAMLLKLHGHSVEIANDGMAALMKARRLRPDVVLLDIGLPSMDGYEVARRLREELGRQILIVAVTGFARDEDRRLAVTAGFDHHLVKPVDPTFISSLLG